MMLITNLNCIQNLDGAYQKLLTGEDEQWKMAHRTITGSQTEQGHRQLSDGSEIRMADKITEMALEELYSRSDPETYRFGITPRWIPGSLASSSAEELISVTLAGNIERYTVFDVSYRERGRVERVQVQMALEIERQMPVAARRIMNGEMLDEQDIMVSWISVPHDRGQLVSEADFLGGKTIRRTLSVGQPFRYADVSSALIIEAGETVQLIFEQAGIQIEMTVEARQSGAQDEEIHFYSHETRKRYAGRIVGPGVARWTKTL